VARKNVVATANRPPAKTVTTSDVDPDAKHTDSPLCACRDCNDAWLKRRDEPKVRKHVRVSTPPINADSLKPFAVRCKKLGIMIELKNTHNLRIAFWRLVDPSTFYTFTAGFDADVAAVLARMEHEGRDLRGAAADLFAPRGSGPVRSSSQGNLTGGPFCVVCDVAGGLPCPSMVKTALSMGIKLAYPPGDARLVPNHVHPGRCRKRLRQLLDAVAQQRKST
jgi:hypothetical protein